MKMNNKQKKRCFRIEWTDGAQSFVPDYRDLFEVSRRPFTIQRVLPDVHQPEVWWIWQKKLTRHNFVDNPPHVPFRHVARAYAPEV
jgi:hypothetical protein